jgi:hypothetical protein
MVFIKIGKKTINALIMIFESRPGPNQMTRSGAIATIGMDCEATIYGDRNRSTVLDFARP